MPETHTIPCPLSVLCGVSTDVGVDVSRDLDHRGSGRPPGRRWNQNPTYSSWGTANYRYSYCRPILPRLQTTLPPCAASIRSGPPVRRGGSSSRSGVRVCVYVGAGGRSAGRGGFYTRPTATRTTPTRLASDEPILRDRTPFQMEVELLPPRLPPGGRLGEVLPVEPEEVTEQEYEQYPIFLRDPLSSRSFLNPRVSGRFRDHPRRGRMGSRSCHPSPPLLTSYPVRATTPTVSFRTTHVSVGWEVWWVHVGTLEPRVRPVP